MKPIAYEGREPYIFVSYAHKDAERIFEVLAELQDRGYRFWYDDGIAPGSEWPEDIARHLDSAAVVVAFVTQNSMNSQNCRREINFSLSREKPFLSVLMEQTEMPLGMQMQLSAQQSIVRYNFDTWEGFIAKILSCPDLAPCQQAICEAPTSQGAQAEPTMSESNSEVQVAIPANGREQTEAESGSSGPDDSQPSSQKGHVDAEPDRLDDARASASHRSASIPVKHLPLVVAALVVLALVAVLTFGLGSHSSPTTYVASWGSSIYLDTNSVIVRDTAVTQEDVETFAQMENLTSLYFYDCDLSGCNLSQLAQASAPLKTLDLSGSTGIDDLSFLANLPLKKLHLSGWEAFDDLSLLPLEHLEELYVDGTGISDLSPLAEASQLQVLDFSDTAVTDLTPLEQLSSLQGIAGARTHVTSLEALFGLENLTALDFSGCAPADSLGITVSPAVPLTIGEQQDAARTTFASLSLTTIRLNDADIVDLNAFQNCTRIEELCLSGHTGLDDLSWFDSQNYATLERLDLSHTKLTPSDLAFVAQCPKLKALKLDGLELGDLSFMDGLTSLTYLSAVNCGLTDISPLTSCTYLNVVLLSHNKITDASPLKYLAYVDASSTLIDLSYNALTSVAPLARGTYRALFLQGNADEIGGTIGTDVNAWELVVPWYAGLLDSDIAEGKDRYYRIYLIGCPENQILNVQDALGSSCVEFVTTDELSQLMSEDALEYPLRQIYDYPFQPDFSYALSVTG